MINNYNQPFEISKNIGNNVFCFNKEKNSTIYIPKLIQTNINEFRNKILDYIKVGSNIAFREQKQGEIIEYKGLKKFLQIETSLDKANCPEGGGSCKQNIYIIDNHNHALYFWYKEYFAGNIQKGINLIHIDQHTDMNKNIFTITKKSLEGIYNFTNNKCNVGNFIKPAIDEGLISKITQINTEYSLLNYNIPISLQERSRKAILDIDLDFRAPEMRIEKYKKTINITKNLIKNSIVVTIATSPYFLDQNLAIKIIQDLFEK